jgi:hypothetical protein
VRVAVVPDASVGRGVAAVGANLPGAAIRLLIDAEAVVTDVRVDPG